MSEALERHSRVPMFATMGRIPGGLMILPLLLGVLFNTFAPQTLEIGSFTTALFKDGALALIGLLIFATGAQITGSRSGGATAQTTLVVLVTALLAPKVAAGVMRREGGIAPAAESFDDAAVRNA
jgi:2-keto-3-deoxygluconate permease